MKNDLPQRIASAARSLARIDFQLSQLDGPDVKIRPQITEWEAVSARRRLRVLKLRRDMAAAELEQLRNELRVLFTLSPLQSGDAA